MAPLSPLLSRRALSQRVLSRRIATAALLGCLAATTLLASPDAAAQEADGIPAWVLDDMTRTVGRWVADNAAYQSENEPFDAYGLEWTWGPGRKSLNGRLFGLQDGKDAGTFWEFRQFWHPGERQVMLYQFGGDGTVGTGAHTQLDSTTTSTLQTFYRPDGTTYRVGHRTVFEGDVHHGRSYDVGTDDTWTERRYYVWHRTAS